MKRLTLGCLLVCTGITFITFSCKSKEKEAEKTEPTPAAETAAPANTIITTPENMVVAMHKVSNYAKWKSNYDAHDSIRLANGLHSYVIGRGMNDSNMVLVALKADDMQKAKAFASSSDLKKAMQKGGVTGPVTMKFIVAAWQDTAAVGSIPRSLTTFTVKEWDTWQKNFQEGKQERLDNGIQTRLVGHDADDNKKVSLVTALADTSKAFAYYKSDALKKRMEAGGLTSEPTRFIFHIAQRY